MRSWNPADVYTPIGTKNIVLYDGPSQLTGDPILVIATAKNGNRKIGRMLQLWILPAGSPLAALRSGADASVCGDCKWRGDGHGQGRACYVWSPGVDNIWQARAKARRLEPAAFAEAYPGLQLRIGAYGDPVAVPIDVWLPLLITASGWTAYTHQWRRPMASPYRSWCMASVDTADEQREATCLGWRTFRVRLADERVRDDEVSCPASQEGGHKALCAQCELCRGRAARAKHVAIVAHGSSAIHVPAARARFIPLEAVR